MASALSIGCSDDGAAVDEDAAPTTPVPPIATSTSTGPPPTFTGDAGSPFCSLLRDVDLGGVLAGDQADPEQLGRAFQQVVDLLVQAAELAPTEILADVALVADGMTSLDSALAAVGYDFDALAASGSSDAVVEAVNDPAFTEAGVRLAAYRAQVCEL